MPPRQINLYWPPFRYNRPHEPIMGERDKPKVFRHVGSKTVLGVTLSRSRRVEDGLQRVAVLW